MEYRAEYLDTAEDAEPEVGIFCAGQTAACVPSEPHVNVKHLASIYLYVWII